MPGHPTAEERPDERAVGDLLADHTPEVAALARRVRDAVLAARPDLLERVRLGWHSINYRHPAAGFVCGIFPAADRVALLFERGAELPDPAGLLTGRGRQVRELAFAPGQEVDGEVVGCYLDLAVDHGTARRLAAVTTSRRR